MSLFSNDIRVANTAAPSFQSIANVGQFGWTGADQGHYNQLVQYVDECRKIWIDLKDRIDYVDEIFKDVEGVGDQIVYINTVMNELSKWRQETLSARDQVNTALGNFKPLYDDFVDKYPEVVALHGEVVVLHGETITAKDESVVAAAGAKESEKNAEKWASEIKDGQTYRGTWNPHTAAYPDAEGTNSMWDVVLNPGETAHDWGGETWHWGDRLVYVKSSTAYQRIESGSGVLSVNGKTGAVTLNANEVGAVSKTGGEVTGSLNLNAASKQVTFLNDKNYISMGGNNMYLAALDKDGRVVLQGEKGPLANVGGTDYTIYHTGNKPSANEIGAATPAGFTLTGAIKIGNAPTNIQTGTGKNAIRTGGSNESVIIGNDAGHVFLDTIGGNVTVRVGTTEYRVYHAGNKPTLADLGAASSSDVASISARAKDRFDVRDFGAKGDGVTDDTFALQTALEKGGEVYFPKGVYLVKKTLTVKSHTTILGAGIDVAIIRADASLPGQLDLLMNENAMSATLSYDSHINIFDITIDAKGFSRKKDVSGEWGRAIRLGSVHDCLLQRVRAHEGPQHCVDITNHNDDYIGKGHAARLSGESYNVTVKDCIFSDYCHDDGITTHAANNIIIEDCVSTISDYAKTKKVYTHNQNGFEIDDGSKYVVVRNCRAYGNNIAGKGFSTACHGQNPATYNVTFEDCWAHGTNIFGAAWTDLVTDVDPHGEHWLARNITYNRCTFVKPALITTSNLFPSRCVSATGIQNLKVLDFKLYMTDTDYSRWASVSLSEFNTTEDLMIDGYSIYGVNNVNDLPEIQKNSAWIAIRSDCKRVVVKNVFVDAMGSMDRVVSDTASRATTLVENIRVERAPPYDATKLKYGIVCGADAEYRNVVVPEGLMTPYSIGDQFSKPPVGNYKFQITNPDITYGGLKIVSLTNRDGHQPQAGMYFDNTFYDLAGESGKGSISYRATTEKARTFSITAHMDDGTYKPMMAIRNFKNASDIHEPMVIPGSNNQIFLGSSSFRWKTVYANVLDVSDMGIFGKVNSTRGFEATGTGVSVVTPGGNLRADSVDVISLEGKKDAFVTAREGAHLCSNAYHDGTAWKKFDNSKASHVIIAKQDGLYHMSSIAGSANAEETTAPLGSGGGGGGGSDKAYAYISSFFATSFDSSSNRKDVRYGTTDAAKDITVRDETLLFTKAGKYKITWGFQLDSNTGNSRATMDMIYNKTNYKSAVHISPDGFSTSTGASATTVTMKVLDITANTTLSTQLYGVSDTSGTLTTIGFLSVEEI